MCLGTRERHVSCKFPQGTFSQATGKYQQNLCEKHQAGSSSERSWFFCVFFVRWKLENCMSLWFWFLHVKFDSDLAASPHPLRYCQFETKPLSKKTYIHSKSAHPCYIYILNTKYTYYIYIYTNLFLHVPSQKKKNDQDLFLGGLQYFPNSSGPINQPPMRISSLRMLSHKSPGIKNTKKLGKKNGLQSSQDWEFWKKTHPKNVMFVVFS